MQAPQGSAATVAAAVAAGAPAAAAAAGAPGAAAGAANRGQQHVFSDVMPCLVGLSEDDSDLQLVDELPPHQWQQQQEEQQ